MTVERTGKREKEKDGIRRRFENPKRSWWIE